MGIVTGDGDSRALIEGMQFKQLIKLSLRFSFMLSLTDTNYIINFILYK